MSFDAEAYETKWGVKLSGNPESFTMTGQVPSPWTFSVRPSRNGYKCEFGKYNRIESKVLPSFILRSGMNPNALVEYLNASPYATAYPAVRVWYYSRYWLKQNEGMVDHYYDYRSDTIFWIKDNRVYRWLQGGPSPDTIELEKFNEAVVKQGWVPNYAAIFGEDEIPELIPQEERGFVDSPADLSKKERSFVEKDKVTSPFESDYNRKTSSFENETSSSVVSGTLKIVSEIFSIADEISKLKATSSAETRFEEMNERLSKIERELESIKKMLTGKFAVEGNLKFISE